MASVIYPDGNVVAIKPKNKLFTLIEISKFLEGIVEPSFIGNNWVFVNKNGLLMRKKFNLTASEMMGFEIFGSCMLISNEELPCQFFMIGEEFDENDPNDEFYPDDYHEDEEIDNLDNKLMNEKVKQPTKEEEEAAIDYLYSEAYKNLIDSNIPFEELMKNFIIYKDELSTITPNTVEDRVLMLKNMIEHYIKKEQYEKCTKITKLLNYIEN